LLIANLTHGYVAETDGEYSEFSLHDLGQAVAHITLRAGRSGQRDGRKVAGVAIADGERLAFPRPPDGLYAADLLGGDEQHEQSEHPVKDGAAEQEAKGRAQHGAGCGASR
jgi:hypothetical protein